MHGITNDVLVVGAGAAGLMAAWRAAASGASVLLLERNPRLGAKILISGGGKCNITHAGAMDELLGGFPARQARFLKPSFYRFPNTELIRLIESNGLVTHVRDDGRIFPRDGYARDVVAVFDRMLRAAGVRVERSVHVTGLRVKEGMVRAALGNGVDFPAAAVIVTTGGVSYPKTGTTGDGHEWAARAGHRIVPLRAALAPIAVTPPLPAEWRGVALRGGALRLFTSGRQTASWSGDVLISHEGVTGPAALELSNAAAGGIASGEARLAYDFAPEKDEQGLDDELLAVISQHRGRTVQNILDLRLPARIVPAVLAGAGIDCSTRGYVLTRQQRRTLAITLKRWDLGAVAAVDIRRGEVTAGGIALDEVDPHTMRSRLVSGLLFAGEILDIDGRIGGYNLQAAFSTGYVAGESAVRATMEGPIHHA